MTILGGPDPWENGKIAMYGFHAGEDKHGRTFGQAFPNFKETYLTPFTRFLREVYPADVRLARALKQDEDAPGKSSQDGVGSSSKPVPDDRDVVNGEQVDEEIVMESASKTNSTEGHKAADDIDVKESRGVLRKASNQSNLYLLLSTLRLLLVSLRTRTRFPPQVLVLSSIGT
ncbi:hypothetical protein EV421DRAFT_515189 [Armillaria borealis]|uniref:Uncharacterized protein n=1 Tax=Armillaria borealis TaxID=47425 RepID=A0AA39JM55_9AGAR|nr:hypothetical protein EV421DRAFT_515189 [Armillaria borealis]